METAARPAASNRDAFRESARVRLDRTQGINTVVQRDKCRMKQFAGSSPIFHPHLAAQSHVSLGFMRRHVCDPQTPEQSRANADARREMKVKTPDYSGNRG
jgi:hypothetical protein